MTAFAMFLQQSLEASSSPAREAQRRAEIEQRVFDRTGRCAVCQGLIAAHFSSRNAFVGCAGARHGR